jgi:hypothetical protein
VRALAGTLLIGAVALTATCAGAGAAAKRQSAHCRGHAPSRVRRCPSRRRQAAAPVPASDAVGVLAHEYRLTLTRPGVHSGKVIVEFGNEGEDPHNLVLAPLAASGELLAAPQLGFATLLSGRRATRAVTLTPGTWRLWCTLPGHDAAGMHATLTVSAAGKVAVAHG